VEDYVGPDYHWDEPLRETLVPPRLAAVLLACGSRSGGTFAAGVRLSCRRACSVGEACLFAAEFVGSLNGHGAMTMVSFAPATGRCLVCFAGMKEGLASQPMPPIEGPAAADAESEVLEAFLLVSASGGVSFGRRRGAAARMEWSGELAREFCPSWSTEIYASLNFQIDQLCEPAQVSVTWIGFGLPALLASHTAPSMVSAAWDRHEW